MPPTAPSSAPAVTRPATAALLLLVVAGTVAAAVGVQLSGVVLPPVLRDPGAVVRWGLPLTGVLRELASATTIGALALAVTLLPRALPGRDAARPRSRAREVDVDGRAYPLSLVVAAWAAAVWALVCVAHLVLTYASVAGRPLTAPSFGAELGLFLIQVSLGKTLLIVTMIAAVVSALALLAETPTGAAWTLAVAIGALAVESTTGHAAAATASHELAMSSLFVHLVGAALWIGSLAALAAVRGRVGRDLGATVARYSVVAGWCFVAVAVSGTVNGAIRIGGPADLTTRYGQLLLTKVVLLLVLGGLGWVHRQRVVDRLRGEAGVVSRATWLFWRLVLVELAVMGAVSGVAVALVASPPPVPEVAPTTPTPAEIVTGHALPPEPTALRWLTEWRWDLLLAGAAAAGLVVYLRWVLRLRRRGDGWPVGRTVCWVVGLLLFAWTTSGGPAMYGHVLFSAHMVQHMILAMVVPIFLVLGAPITLALRALPSRADASRGPREWILVLVQSHVGRFVSNPLVAAVNFAGSMVLFYYTDAFRFALTTYVGHVAMVAHFTLAGYLFVNALVGVDPGPQRPPYPQRLLLLFATMAFHAFFGVALVSGEQLLVADWFGLLGRPWGLSALADQQNGGAVAWGIGELPMLALAVVLAVSWTRDDERTARRRDRQADREGDVELDEYNAMLARMAERDREQ